MNERTIEIPAWPNIDISTLPPESARQGADLYVPLIPLEGNETDPTIYDLTTVNGPDNQSYVESPFAEGDERHLTPHTLTSVTVRAHGFAMHVDSFGGMKEDNGRLAYTIAVANLGVHLSTILSRGDVVARIIDKLVPSGNVRNSLRKNRTYVTFEEVLRAVGEVIDPLTKEFNLSGNAGRYLRAALAELLVRMLSAYIGVQRTNPVALLRWQGDIIPSLADLKVAVQAREIKRQIDSFASISNSSEVTYSVMTRSVVDMSALMGVGLIRAYDASSYVDTALGILHWYLHHPIMLGFPEEMLSNQHMLTLASNASVMRLATDVRNPVIASRLTKWEMALTAVTDALNDSTYFTTMPLSTFATYFGHEVITGLQNRVLGVLCYANIPGSSPAQVYIPLTVDVHTKLGRIVMLDRPTNEIVNLTSHVCNRTSAQWVELIEPVFRQALSVHYNDLGEKSLTEGTKFMRFGMSEEVMWIYAASLSRTLQLVHVSPSADGTESPGDKPTTRLDFVVNLAAINAPITLRSMGGLLRTTDPRIVIMANKPQMPTALMPLVSDNLPVKDLGSLLFLNTLIPQDDFGTGETLSFRFQFAKTYNTVVEHPFHLLAMYSPVPAEKSHAHRTLMLTHAVALATKDLLDMSANEVLTKQLVGRVYAKVLLDDVALTARGKDIMQGLAQKMLTATRRSRDAGGEERTVSLATDIQLTQVQIDFAAMVGRYLATQLGVLSKEDGEAWLSLLVESGYSTLNALSGSRFIDVGSWMPTRL